MCRIYCLFVAMIEQKWFRIVLDRADKTVMPGDTISGYLDICFPSQQSVRAIYVNVYGHARTYWSKQHEKHRDM